jgi:hypothetical protein
MELSSVNSLPIACVEELGRKSETMRGYYEVRPDEWWTRCFGQTKHLEHANSGVLISQLYCLEAVSQLL